MQDKKRTAKVVEDAENRGCKRQRRSEESITIHSPQPARVGHSLSIMNTRTDDTTTLASGQYSMNTRIPDVNVTPMSDTASQSSKIVIPSKRRNPFGEGGLRKRKKAERYVYVRIYAQPKDVQHIREIKCALTPDGGLDLTSLSQELNLKGCQAS
jgi:hypothetical protein